jgi:CelD/BcsL family acetyltransferase involved in cellulose biosynthesis
LCDFPDQRRGNALVSQRPQSSLTCERVHHRICPYLALPATWDQFLGRLGTHMRSNIKRRRKNLAKHFSAEYITISDAATLTPSMDALFHLHTDRWRRRGVGGAFAGAPMQSFHREIALRFLSRGWLRLHLLVLDGKPCAALYGFQYRRRVYHYLGGFALSYSRFGPGVVLQSYAIEHAIGAGATEFDMLRGDESYKYFWKCEERETQRLIISHASLRSSMARTIHRIERYAEHRGLAIQRRLWGGRGRSKG